MAVVYATSGDASQSWDTFMLNHSAVGGAGGHGLRLSDIVEPGQAPHLELAGAAQRYAATAFPDRTAPAAHSNDADDLSTLS